MKTTMVISHMEEPRTAAGVTYRVQGELVPVLQFTMDGGSVYFEHHTLLWKDPRVNVEVMKLKGAWKRFFAGLPLIMTRTRGNGFISFSRDTPGHIVAKHLEHNQVLHMREHQLLAATSNVEYGFDWMPKLARNVFLGSSGVWIDRFTAGEGEGIVFMHGHGNVFEIELAGGESIDIEPGAWIYKDPSVDVTTVWTSLSTGFLASTNLFMNRFTGPGVVGVQSMYWEPPAQSKS